MELVQDRVQRRTFVLQLLNLGLSFVSFCADIRYVIRVVNNF
jgi:hypothetical protein